jgi:hypothetical protein
MVVSFQSCFLVGWIEEQLIIIATTFRAGCIQPERRAVAVAELRTWFINLERGRAETGVTATSNQGDSDEAQELYGFHKGEVRVEFISVLQGGCPQARQLIPGLGFSALELQQVAWLTVQSYTQLVQGFEFKTFDLSIFQ